MSYKFMQNDDRYFIIVSKERNIIYVYDNETYDLVNTIDLSKELGVDPNDVWNFGSIDMFNGKVYVLQRAGIFVADCKESRFEMLLDGSKYEDFYNRDMEMYSLVVDKNEDFYILGVYGDEEAATELWHYTKKD